MMADVEKAFQELQRAYTNKDINTMMSMVTDDYSVYNVTAAGPKKLVSSRDEAAKALEMVFGNENYISGHAESIQAVGNIVHATEIDIYSQNGQRIQATRFGVYEFVGEKLSRAWNFAVRDAN
jgi:hypothetical protein